MVPHSFSSRLPGRADLELPAALDHVPTVSLFRSHPYPASMEKHSRGCFSRTKDIGVEARGSAGTYDVFIHRAAHCPALWTAGVWTFSVADTRHWFLYASLEKISN